MASALARRLAPTQRNFVELHVVDGLPIYRAYLKAFKEVIACRGSGTITETSAARAGRILLDKPPIKEYVEELKELMAERSHQKKFLSFDEKREFLAKIVRTPAGHVDENDAIAEEVRRSPDGTLAIKMSSKLKALELDTRIMGEFKDSVRVEVSEKVLNLADSFA